MVLISRRQFPREIINPDTYGHYALRTNRGLVFAVLYTPDDVEFFTIRPWGTTPASPEEVAYYNAQLSYMQNYHPAEMYIEEVLRNYFQV